MSAHRQAAYEAEVLRHWHGNPDGAHDLAHLRRVWRNCQKIARAEGGADLEVLLAAAIFHDVVNLPKDAPNRAEASRLSAELAARYHRLLADLGQRVRDVREGPDGLLYLLTDERNGQLIRLLPPG